MGLWILESKSMEHVPGTTRYFDDPERPQIATDDSARGLKCDRSGKVPIILVPQPSDDPNDPLNWPIWKRDAILLILSLTSIFATCLGPIFAADAFNVSTFFSVKLTNVGILTGWYLIGVGAAGVLFVPSARIWGKRHLFLLGTVLVIITSAWGGASRSYSSMAAARVFQGVATAPFEALVNASVGDLYFVHERGIRMALTNLAVFGGAFFTPIVVGKLSRELGWPWSFYFLSIFTGVCLPLVIFFVPETAFHRDSRLNTDMASTDDVRETKNGEQESYELRNSHGDDIRSSSDPIAEETGEKTTVPGKKNISLSHGGADTPMRSYKQSLMPFNGRVSDDSFFKLFLRPFVLFAHPAVLWACIIQGAMIGWTVFIGIILAAIFIMPPLFWTEVKTGYAYTGAFLGAIGGFLLVGLLADWSAKWMTRRNNGIYEPEFRIILVLPQMIIGCTGLYLFAVTSANIAKYSYILPIFAFGLEVAGMVIGCVAASLYIVDAHRDIAIEAFTTILIFKNFFAAGLSWSAYEWLVKGGQYKVFVWLASVQLVICLTAIPMYVFGKRNRSFFHRHDVLGMVGLA